MEAKRLGNIFGYTAGNFPGNVYDKFSLSPTLNTMQGGNKQPMIIIYDDYNHRVRADQTCIGTLTTNIGNGALGHGTKLIEKYNKGGNETVDEPCIIREPPLEKEGWHRNAKEVLNVNGLCRRLNTQSNNLCTKIKEEPSFRIRKLTPKECYRLMGFDDEAFERAEQVNSNTQLYKQAGNSIVVDVLVAIFDNLLVHSRSAWLDELLESEQEFCQRTAKKKPVMKVREGTKQGWSYAGMYDCVDPSYPNSKTRRDRVSVDSSHTLTTAPHQFVIVPKKRRT